MDLEEGIKKENKFGECLLCGAMIKATTSPSACTQHLLKYHNIKKEMLIQNLVEKKENHRRFGTFIEEMFSGIKTSANETKLIVVGSKYSWPLTWYQDEEFREVCTQ